MKKILDACCGGRMTWYQKDYVDALFMDIRTFEKKMSNGQNFKVAPDLIGDFRKMEFPDESFSLVLYDPPHIKSLGSTSFMAQKYGILNKVRGKEDIKEGFDECMRVLKPNGVLVFKWSVATSRKGDCIPIGEILKVIGHKPLFGTRPGSRSGTYWLIFMKV